VWTVGSEFVQYCVQDWHKGYEPGVMNVRVQSYLLRVILEIIVSVLFSLPTIFFICSINKHCYLLKPGLIGYNTENFNTV